MLKKGSTGKEVIDCQRRLNELGYGHLSLDGIFGENTERAVESFQEGNGLLVDGIIGPNTSSLLREVRLPLKSDLFEKNKYEKIALENARNEACEKVLLSAVGDIGKKESPLGSNTGEEIVHLVTGYNEYWQIKSLSYPPWCAIAISSWIKIGLEAQTWGEIPFKKWFGAVDQISTWGKENNRFFEVGEKEAKAGDIIILSRSGSSSDISGKNTAAGHTGFILADEDDRFLTIEANVSDRVKVCYRPKNTTIGVVDWSS